jgi:PAB1-binding protein PBP1
MNPDNEITPEEKLLNLIRRPDKKLAKQKAQDNIASSKEKSSSISSGKPAVSVISNKKDKKSVFVGIKLVNFALVNRLILFVAFLSLALFSVDIFLRSPNSSKYLSHQRENQKTVLFKEKKTAPYSYYQQEIAKKNIFRSGSVEAKSKKVIPAGTVFKELIKDLKLLGIVSGDKSQAIIEDQKARQTYFLYAGDLLGEIKLEEVYSDRIILEFKGERISLFL